jgi:hypothetical protein
MKNSNELDVIKRLVSGGTHVPPSVEVLKSELRTDSGVEPPIKPPPSPLVYIIVKWKYHVHVANLDKFHAFLQGAEDEIIADVKDLKLGAAYMGTYAELPGCRLHQTFWSYKSLSAIDQFKAALAGNPKSPLYKNMTKLASFIDDPTMGMHRLVRASALAGLVTAQRKVDPILDMFAASK